MARFNASDYEKYGGQGGGGFFGIANDGDIKQVRFMYETTDDIIGMSVHRVEVNGKERYVNCLRAYNDPMDNCPFCRERMTPQARLFIPVYNIEEDVAQIWDRGKTMFQSLMSQCKRCSNEKHHIVNTIFEIERNGKPKDPKTTYGLFPVDKDETELADLPDAPKILGGFVLDKTAEEMDYYLENKEFPPTEDEEQSDEPPVRRRESRDREEPRRDNRRRTPARSGRRNEDEY